MSLVAASLSTGDHGPRSGVARRGRGEVLSPLGSTLDSSLGSPLDPSQESSFGTVALDVLVTRGGLLNQDDVQRIEPFVDDFLQAGSQLMELWALTPLTYELSARAARANRRTLSANRRFDQDTSKSNIASIPHRLNLDVPEGTTSTSGYTVNDNPILPKIHPTVKSQTEKKKSLRRSLRKRTYSNRTGVECPTATTELPEMQSEVRKIKVMKTERSLSPVDMRCTRSQTRMLREFANEKRSILEQDQATITGESIGRIVRVQPREFGETAGYDVTCGSDFKLTSDTRDASDITQHVSDGVLERVFPPQALVEDSAGLSTITESIQTEVSMELTLFQFRPSWTTVFARRHAETQTVTSVLTRQTVAIHQQSNQEHYYHECIYQYYMQSSERWGLQILQSATESTSVSPSTVTPALSITPIMETSESHVPHTPLLDPANNTMAHIQMVHRPQPCPLIMGTLIEYGNLLNLMRSPVLKGTPVPSKWSAFHCHIDKCTVCDRLNHIRHLMDYLLGRVANPPASIIPTPSELLDITGLDSTSSPISSPPPSPIMEETLEMQISDVVDVPLVGAGPEGALFGDENSSDFIAAELQAIEAEKKSEQSITGAGCSEDSSICSVGSFCGTIVSSETSDSSGANTPTSSPSRQRPSPSSPSGPQQCTVCNKVFSNGSALAKHKLTHSDERRYICSVCHKAFKRQDHLNGHMLTHRNKKPYECTLDGCSKSYCDSRSLRRHEENHHNVKGLLNVKSTQQDSERTRFEKRSRLKNSASQSLGFDNGTHDCSSSSSDCSAINTESCGSNSRICPDVCSNDLERHKVNVNFQNSALPRSYTKGTQNNALTGKDLQSIAVIDSEHVEERMVIPSDTMMESSIRIDRVSLSSDKVRKLSCGVDDPSETKPRSPTIVGTEIHTLSTAKAPKKELISLHESHAASVARSAAFETSQSSPTEPPTAFNKRLAQRPTDGKSNQSSVGAEHSKTTLIESSLTHDAQPRNHVLLPEKVSVIDWSEKKKSWPCSKVSKLKARSSISPIYPSVQDRHTETMLTSLKSRPHTNETSGPLQDCPPDANILGVMPVLTTSRTIFSNQETTIGGNFAGERPHTGEAVVHIVRGTSTSSKKMPLKVRSGNETCLSGNMSVAASKTADEVTKDPKCYEVATATQSKPVACNLCNRRFKNIPALNGHMRLHGGYFKKESEAKRVDKRESTGPPLQTASVVVRKLINDKITQRQAGSPSATALQTRDDSTSATASPISFNKATLSETVAMSSVLKHHNYANSSIPLESNAYGDQLSTSMLKMSQRSTSSYPALQRNDQLLNHSEDPLLSSTIKDIVVRKSEFKNTFVVQGDGGSLAMDETIALTRLQTTSCNSAMCKKESLSAGVKMSPYIESPFSESSYSNILPPKRARVEEKFPCYKSHIRHDRTEAVAPTSLPYTPGPMLNPCRAAVGLYSSLSSSECFVKPDNESIVSITADSQSFPRINVGGQFQSSIPVCAEDPYEWTDESELDSQEALWRPSVLTNCTEAQVEKYLEFSCSDLISGGGSNKEQALRILSECDGNIPEAMVRTMRSKDYPQSSTLRQCNESTWSIKEIDKFVDAMRTLGKDFHAVSKQVSSKTTKECVQLYYFWKSVCRNEFLRVKENWCDSMPERNLANSVTKTAQTDGPQERTSLESDEPLKSSKLVEESDQVESLEMAMAPSNCIKVEPTELLEADVGVLTGCKDVKKEISDDFVGAKDTDLIQVGSMLRVDGSLGIFALERASLLACEELQKSGITDEHISAVAHILDLNFQPTAKNEGFFDESLKLQEWNVAGKDNTSEDETRQSFEDGLQKLEDIKHFKSETKAPTNTEKPSNGLPIKKSLDNLPQGDQLEERTAAKTCNPLLETSSVTQLSNKEIQDAKDERNKSVGGSSLHEYQVPPEHRLFVCGVGECTASFNSKGALTGHSRLHGAQKPSSPTYGQHRKDFVCDTCGMVFSKPKFLNAHRPVHEKLVRLTEKARTDKTKESRLSFNTCRNFVLSSSGQGANHTGRHTSAPPCENSKGVISHAYPDICEEDTTRIDNTVAVLERATSINPTVIKWSALNVLNSQSNPKYGLNTKKSIKNNLFSPAPFSRTTLNKTFS